MSNPEAAEARAAELLSGTADPWLQSVARHARGLAQRERGDFARALPELRSALRLAASTATPTGRPTSGPRSASRWPWPARTAQGLAQLDRAVAEAVDPALAPRVLMRRGYVLSAIVGGTTTLSLTTRGRSRARAGRATGSGRRAPSTTSPGCTSSWDTSEAAEAAAVAAERF